MYLNDPPQRPEISWNPFISDQNQFPNIEIPFRACPFGATVKLRQILLYEPQPELIRKMLNVSPA
jgi:hypothetical protein